MLQFVIDPIPAHIETSYVAVFGWMRSEQPPASVEVLADETPVYHELHSRLDLANVYPAEYTTGLYAVVDVAASRPQIEQNRGQLRLRVRVDHTLWFDQTVTVSDAALAQATDGLAYREAKREFVRTHAACPACGAPLAIASGRPEVITCSRCGTAFPQRTHAWTMIPGAAPVPRLLSTSVFAYSAEERALIDDVAARGGMVLDFGAGLRQTIEPRVVNLEIADYPTTDVVAASDRLPFVDGSFDAVITLHVLEHLRRPWRAAEEIARVLKPGAVALCTVPFVCPEHGFPDHFFNMTRSGLASLFEGMTLERHFMKGDAAPINGLQQLVSTYYGNLPEPHRTTFGNVRIADLVHTPLHELMVKDFVVNLPEHARWKLAAHTTVLVRKT